MTRAFKPSITKTIALSGHATAIVDCEVCGDFLIHHDIASGSETCRFAVTPINSMYTTGSFKNITVARKALALLSALPGVNWKGEGPSDIFPDRGTMRAAYDAIRDLRAA